MQNGQFITHCLFLKDGEDVWELVNESFILFVKSELAKITNLGT